jgi:hypothetical protein
MSIKAINKKYQSAINKAYKAYREYYRLVDLDDSFELYSKELRKNELKQELVFDKHLEYLAEMPQREQINFVKMHTKIHGYS